MKKIFSIFLVLCLCVFGITTLTACNSNTIEVATEAEFINALESAKSDDTIKLTADLTVANTVVITKKITLDLNGKTINNTSDIWQNETSPKSWSLISVGENGDLTITGNGKVLAKENDCYAIDLNDGGKCCIENGEFAGNLVSVYVNKGEMTIKGGSFYIQQREIKGDPCRYTLNCYDNNYNDGTAKIVVMGGTFKEFNPACNLAEGENTNFVKDGYEAVANELNPVSYTVNKIEK